MVFNATFNNISVISWRSVLLVEETGGRRTDNTMATIKTTKEQTMIYKTLHRKLKVEPHKPPIIQIGLNSCAPEG
jgi:hypothetical protein